MNDLRSIQEQIRALQEQERELLKTERKNVIKSIREQMECYGIELKELEVAATTSKRTIQPKYRSPEGQEWSGRGIAPKWAKEAKEKGTLESYLIAKQV